MALIKCPKCGKEFSDRAESCPQCGTSKEEIQRLIEEQTEELAQKRARNFKRAGVVLLATLLVFCIYVVYINVTPIPAKNKTELEVAIKNPLRFVKNTDSIQVRIPYGTKKIEKSAFENCWNIRSFTIPNSVTSIGERAFFGCCNLTTIIIPNSVTSIREWAFSGCRSLKSITIPRNVTSIESGVFESCSGIDSIMVDQGNTKYDSRNNCNAIIETATNKLIVGCQNTVIPNTVTEIGKEAFRGCYTLTSITIPNNVISIGDFAFHGCSSLISITLPNNVTSIGEWAFSDCSSLMSITIPNSVTSIGVWVFYGCRSLPVLDNIRYADTYVVEVVDETLSSYKIKEGTRFIGDGVFKSCRRSLTSITIPNSLTSIGVCAFMRCDKVSSITSKASIPPTCESSLFSYIPKSIPVYVPATSIDAYRNAVGWKRFTNIQAIKE